MAQNRPLRAEEPEPPDGAVYLEILLLGTTGAGKSSTGNSILLKKGAFRVSNFSTSTECAIKTLWSDYKTTNGKQYRLNVTDGPGLHDTNLTKTQDREKALMDVQKMLTECRFGIHAFVFVVRMGVRFTEQDKEVVEYMKRVLGPDFLNTHGIVAISGGDCLNEDNEDLTFDQWCDDQIGDLQELFQDCNNRRVLFNNRIFMMNQEWQEKKQLENLLENIDTVLQENDGKPYNNELFKTFFEEHQRLAFECGYEFVKKEFCTELNSLQGKFRNIKDKSSVMKAKSALDSFEGKVDYECRRTAQVETFRERLVELSGLLDKLLAEEDPETSEFKNLLQDAKKKLDSVVEDSIPQDSNLCGKLLRVFKEKKPKLL